MEMIVWGLLEEWKRARKGFCIGEMYTYIGTPCKHNFALIDWKTEEKNCSLPLSMNVTSLLIIYLKDTKCHSNTSHCSKIILQSVYDTRITTLYTIYNENYNRFQHLNETTYWNLSICESCMCPLWEKVQLSAKKKICVSSIYHTKTHNVSYYTMTQTLPS